MKKIILLALTASFGSNAQAQISVTPVAGVNVSNYIVRLNGKNFGADAKLRLGVCAGALVDIPLNKQFSLQPGLLYKGNGYRTESQQAAPNDGDFTNTRVNTLDVPIKLTYSFNIPQRGRVFIGVGPYVAMNMSGSIHVRAHFEDPGTKQTKVLETDMKMNIGGPSDMLRFDVGGGANVGYQAVKGLFVSIYGQYGQLIDPNDNPGKMHNYNFGIVGGYSFKLKKHKAHSEESTGAKQ